MMTDVFYHRDWTPGALCPASAVLFSVKNGGGCPFRLSFRGAPAPTFPSTKPLSASMLKT